MSLNDSKIRKLKPSSRPVKLSGSHGLYLLVNPFGSASPLLCGVLEITTGIAQLTASSLPYAGKVSAVLTCAAFGGLSVAAQTNCMIHNSGLPLWPYLAGKLCCAAFAGTLGLFLFAFLF